MAAPAEPREDPRVLVRAAVEEAVAPLHRALHALQQRIEELERRPVHAATAAAPAPAVHAHTSAPAATQALAPVAPPARVHTQPQIFEAVMAPSTILAEAAAIDVTMEMGGALDGSRRRRRLLITFVLLLLIIFGGLFGALALSYQPH
jgi:hypothetical protein